MSTIKSFRHFSEEVREVLANGRASIEAVEKKHRPVKDHLVHAIAQLDGNSTANRRHAKALYREATLVHIRLGRLLRQYQRMSKRPEAEMRQSLTRT